MNPGGSKSSKLVFHMTAVICRGRWMRLKAKRKEVRSHRRCWRDGQSRGSDEIRGDRGRGRGVLFRRRACSKMPPPRWKKKQAWRLLIVLAFRVDCSCCGRGCEANTLWKGQQKATFWLIVGHHTRAIFGCTAPHSQNALCSWIFSLSS